MTSFPKVAIIYLTYPTSNWERDINRCLASLEKINYPKDRLELICVESKGNLPPVKDWFAQTWMPKSGTLLPRIHYVFNDRQIGFAGNNNLGLQKAKELGCELVYLLNEDTDTDPDFLIRAVERMVSDPKIAVVQSFILLGEERDKINSSGNAYHYLGFGYSNDYKRPLSSIEYRVSREIGYASGAGELVNIAALDQKDLFDDKFFWYHEDTDLSLRLRMRGYKIVIEPTSIVWHYYEFGKSLSNFYYMERNRYVLMFSYYRFWTLFLLLPIMAVMDVGILLFSIKSGWFFMKLRVYRDFLSPEFWRWIRSRRRDIQRVRIISDREFLRHAVTTIEFQEPGIKNPLLTYVGNPVLKAYWWVAKRLLA